MQKLFSFVFHRLVTVFKDFLSVRIAVTSSICLKPQIYHNSSFSWVFETWPLITTKLRVKIDGVIWSFNLGLTIGMKHWNTKLFRLRLPRQLNYELRSSTISRRIVSLITHQLRHLTNVLLLLVQGPANRQHPSVSRREATRRELETKLPEKPSTSRFRYQNYIFFKDH